MSDPQVSIDDINAGMAELKRQRGLMGDQAVVHATRVAQFERDNASLRIRVASLEQELAALKRKDDTPQE